MKMWCLLMAVTCAAFSTATCAQPKFEERQARIRLSRSGRFCPYQAKLSWFANNGGTNRRGDHENSDFCRGSCRKPRARELLRLCWPRREHGYRHAGRAGGLRSSGGGGGRCRGLYCRQRYCALLGAITTAIPTGTRRPAQSSGRLRIVSARAEKQASGLAARAEAAVLERIG
jgi:hypothetical protein